MAVLLLLTFVGADRPGTPVPTNLIGGPYARLLADSDRSRSGPRRPGATHRRAHRGDHAGRADPVGRRPRLSVRWRAGDRGPWSKGPPDAVAGALDVAVHDYRGKHGQVFTPPAATGGARAGGGRGRSARPDPRLAPLPHGRPADDAARRARRRAAALELITAATSIHCSTAVSPARAPIAVFAFDGFDQRDLDSFSADWFDLPKFYPAGGGRHANQVHGEATMDIQMVRHRPDAKIVLANARPRSRGRQLREDRPAVRIGGPPVPGAVWRPVDRLGL